MKTTLYQLVTIFENGQKVTFNLCKESYNYLDIILAHPHWDTKIVSLEGINKSKIRLNLDRLSCCILKTSVSTVHLNPLESPDYYDNPLS